VSGASSYGFRCPGSIWFPLLSKERVRVRFGTRQRARANDRWTSNRPRGRCTYPAVENESQTTTTVSGGAPAPTTLRPPHQSHPRLRHTLSWDGRPRPSSRRRSRLRLRTPFAVGVRHAQPESKLANNKNFDYNDYLGPTTQTDTRPDRPVRQSMASINHTNHTLLPLIRRRGPG
jgi:hypothetical protein